MLKTNPFMILADIPITTPSFWLDEEECTDEKLRHVFRSCTDEEMPLLVPERRDCLREAGQVLDEVCNRDFKSPLDMH